MKKIGFKILLGIIAVAVVVMLHATKTVSFDMRTVLSMILGIYAIGYFLGIKRKESLAYMKKSKSATLIILAGALIAIGSLFYIYINIDNMPEWMLSMPIIGMCIMFTSVFFRKT